MHKVLFPFKEHIVEKSVDNCPNPTFPAGLPALSYSYLFLSYLSLPILCIQIVYILCTCGIQAHIRSGLILFKQ